MKKITLLLLLILPLCILGQNQSFESATLIQQGQKISANILAGTNTDQFYKTVLPADGTLKIYVNGTNTGNANGFLYMYGYDRRKANGQTFNEYIASTSVGAGEVINDTIIANGRAADTFYFRLVSSQAFSYNLQYEMTDLSPNDAEPNDNFETAIPIAEKQQKEGHISYLYNGTSDQNDYYMTVLPTDGTLKIYVNGKNNGSSNAYLYMYGYDRRKGNGQIFNEYISSTSVKPGEIIKDTIIAYGRAADTFYFRLVSSQAFSYNLQYEIADVSVNDTEPNNDFASATAIENKEQKSGHIGYKKDGSTDDNDFFKTRFPIDGAVKIIVEGINKDGAGGYLYLYGYDNRKGSGQVFATYIAGNTSVKPGEKIYDTLLVTGRQADSFYFRFVASQAFDYKISYEMVANKITDVEPNDVFEQALPIKSGLTYSGQVGYVSGTFRDANDFYMTVLPADGTLKIYVKGINNGSTNGYLYMYGYDRRKANGQIFNDYITSTSVKVGEAIMDTILVYGRAADTFYFHLISSQAFSYDLSYEMIDFYENDAEKNDDFLTALPIAEKQLKQGHIGYLSNGKSDGNDYYMAILPTDGTLKIYVDAINNGSTNGYIYMYGYNRRKANGQIFADYIASTSVKRGDPVSDTIVVFGQAADTFYFHIVSSQPFSYKLSYEMADLSTNDSEPNDDFATAIPIKNKEQKQGHIAYRYNNTSDVDDYYMTILPTDGTLKIYIDGINNGSTNGYMYMYGYNRRKAGGQMFADYIASTSVKRGNAVSDTIVVFGQAADTFYFRIVASQAFSYNLSYEMLDTSQNDLEPNDSFAESIAFQEKVLKKGHIGYAYNGTTDKNDYYSTVLPAQGTMKIYVTGKNISGTSGYLYMNVYDARKSASILGQYIQSTSIASQMSVSDSLIIPCLAIDSIYIQVYSSVGFTYEFSYLMEGNGVSDKEDNNSFATAQQIQIKDTTKGTSGYFQKGVRDNSDYFKMPLPAKGKLTLFVEGKNTSNSNGKLEIFVYNKNKTLLGRRVIDSTVVLAGRSISDSFSVNCVASDSVYLLVNSTVCFTYSFHMRNVDYQPVADLTYERLGNTFGFRPQFSNANDFSWTFGREKLGDTLSNNPYPMITFKPGNHNAKLIVKNNVCNLKDTATVSFIVKGVEYYTPQKAGIGGDLSMSVFGGGLNASTSVTLVKDGITLQPIDLYTNSLQNHLTAIFNIHLANPGLYDVEIKVPGEETIVYKNGLQLDEFIYPETSSEVLGPNRWRINADTKFRLSISNKGNVIANSAVVALIWPKSVDITFENSFYRAAETGTETVVVDGKTYSFDRSGYKLIYDKLNTTTAIDSFNSKPYNGYIRYIIVPFVPAGGVVEYPFIAKSTQNGDANFITYTYKTNRRGSCDNPVYANYEEDVTAAILDGVEGFSDKVKFPPLKILAKTAKVGQKHAGSASAYYGKKFWAWYDGYEFDADQAMVDLMNETVANNEFATQALKDEFTNLVLDGATKKMEKYQEKVDFINKRLANNPNMSAALTEKYLDVLNALPHDQNRRLEVLKAMLQGSKDVKEGLDKLEKLKKLAEDCPELKKQIEELEKNIEKELDIRDPKDKETDRVRSMDPNEISGPAGVGVNRYLNNTQHQNFTIFYENVDTAKASAQFVIVRDTLDKSKYDLSTFEFGNMSIGSKTIRLPQGRKEFVIERNIQQNIPVKVRINGVLDTASGVIEWQFTSIDTITGRVPVLEGFLPPNKNKPEGEGYVSFTIKPLTGLADGTVFQNRASIIFDENEPIITNTWRNVLDIGKPNSSLNARAVSDSLMEINFTGLDGVSGMGYYNLFIKQNNGKWTAMGGSSTNILQLTGSMDSTYSFYVVSQDKVGNFEDKNAFAEATVTLSRALNVQFGLLSGKIAEHTNKLEWNTFGEDEGDYFILERSSDGKDYISISRVEAKGFATNYTHTDSAPLKGSNYYRIKIVNIQGHFVYSNVVLLKIQNSGNLKVYPNPVKDILSIQIKNGSNEKNRLSLINMFGQNVFEKIVSGDKIEIDMQKMAAGLYYLIYRSNGQEEKIKIIKE